MIRQVIPVCSVECSGTEKKKGSEKKKLPRNGYKVCGDEVIKYSNDKGLFTLCQKKRRGHIYRIHLHAVSLERSDGAKSVGVGCFCD